MKKLLVLLVVILAIPTVSAYAASSTSRRFVVRNWKAPITLDSTTPDSTDEVETEEPGKPEEPTTPAPTDEVEMLETDVPEEHSEEPLADDEPLPADDEQAIPSVEEDEDGQGEADEPDADEPPTPAPTSDEVEQSEETAAVGTPAEDGDEEITTDDEPEEVGVARVDIGGSEAQRRARRPRRSRGRMVVASGTGAAEQYTPQIQKNQIPLRKTLSKLKIHF